MLPLPDRVPSWDDACPWTVSIDFHDDDVRTRADAVLVVGDRRYHGWGLARRSPGDPDVPAVGRDLAAARALQHLAHQLLAAAADGVGDFEGRPVTLYL